jgi:hypothetical protein
MTRSHWLGKKWPRNRGMGITGNRPDKATAAGDAKSESRGGSQASLLGRCLTLKFIDVAAPQLHRVEFRYSKASKIASFEQKVDAYFSWNPVPQALSLFCLDYVYHASRDPHRKFVFRGSLAATLRNSKYTDSSFVHALFLDLPIGGGRIEHFKDLFSGLNVGGKEEGDRSIIVDSDFLPADCIEIYWSILGEDRLKTPGEIKRLADQIRISLDIPIPEEEKETSTSKASSSKKQRRGGPQSPPEESKPIEEAAPLSPTEQFRFGKWLAGEVGEAVKIFGKTLKHQPAAQKDFAAEKESTDGQPANPPPKPEQTSLPIEDPPSTKEPEMVAAEEIRQARIDPELFKVKESGHQWPDDMPLIAWGEDEATHNWTLKNAFEGVLIMGATGSGKTTGSGAAIAESFLRSGFGGLVMTVKKDEAERWRKLCVHCGREGDFVAIHRGGDSKLNVLAYEAQVPGRGGGLSENLVAFCRTLLAISSRSQGSRLDDRFWQTAADQLLNATFDLFLLSGSELTFDGLSNFVAAAPTGDVPTSEEAWLKVPVFGGVLAKAKEAAVSAEDKRILQRATSYWLKIYPPLPAKTRASITLGVYSMLDAFRGRDVPALISSTTNITPESIMSGKIVVLDLPLKELGHTGLMVQSSIKYLFQTALERHSRTGDPRHRPVFLWEDEGQHFFSEYDHHFQATARSSRVCRVILSQNVHNFYKEFGPSGNAAANSVFGNLITKIFHANTDPTTNEWAAKHFRQEIHSRLTISHSPLPPQHKPQDLADALATAMNPPSTTGVSTTEHWEYAVRPEEFNCLRNGGPENDFQVDAFITWIAPMANNERHFTHITFNQNPNL